MDAVGTCVLLVVMAGAAEPPGENKPMTLTLLVPASESAPDLESFLSERARETWDVGEEATNETRFEVAVSWPDRDRLVVRVHEGDRELARREVEVADPGATMLTVWLVVKSTINRALLEGAPEEEEEEEEAVEIATPAKSPKESPKEEETAEEPPAPAAAVRKTTDDVVQRPRPSWGLAALLTASVSRIELASFGPDLVIWLNPHDRFAATLEVGYRVSPAVNIAGRGADLTIHYVPVTATFGWQLDEARVWTAGLFVTADVKIPVYETGTKLAAGLDLGGFVHAVLPLTEHSHLFARLFAGARVSRARYLVDEGSITEGPVLGGLGLGALWR